MRWILAIGAAVIVIGIALLAWQLHGESPPAGGAAAVDGQPAGPRQSTSARRSVEPRVSPQGMGNPRPLPPSRPPASPVPPPPPVDPAPARTDVAEPPSLPAVDASPVDEKAARLAEVERLHKQRDYEAARAAATAFLERYPGDFHALRVLIVSLCALGEPDDAKKYLEQLPSSRWKRRTRQGCQDLGQNLD